MSVEPSINHADDESISAINVADDEEEQQQQKDNEFTPTEGIDLPAIIRRYVRIKSKVAREFCAELFGTCILVLFACGSGAQLKFMKMYSPGDNNVVSVNLTGGLSLSLVIVLIGKISGAHVNPAISFAMLLTGRMSLKRFLVYVLAQMMGAFLAACVLYFAYYDAFKNYPPANFPELVGLFGTFPNSHLSTFGGFFDLTFGPMLLTMAVLSLTDKYNAEFSHSSTAIIAGLTVFMIESAFGYNTGNALNPARDFGPRLFSSLVFGREAFTNGNYFFWIPLLAPMFGSFLAVIIYTLLVGNNLF